MYRRYIHKIYFFISLRNTISRQCLFQQKKTEFWCEPLNPDKGFGGFWMSKYETSIKIKVIKEYEKNISQSVLSKKIRYHKQLVQIG